ncbi:MAG: hypothetical protein DRR42_11175 [Gammaproteobacteria bacterium]|nr:MAG: hypothetical protein DRR42_11175 [Gammaproteobacteria bacterium]
MDLEHFLKERLKYSQYFFTHASRPFEDIISAIEAEKPPYVPVYDESGEPQYVQEWVDASTGLESVGITALSMLASSLKLFLNDWVCRIEPRDKPYKRTSGNRGWFHAYKIILKDVGLNLQECPADLELIEQVILARNRGQHAESLINLRTTHSENDLKKYPSPYFVSETDKRIIDFDDGDQSWWLTPHIFVDQEKLVQVTSEVEKMCVWLEECYRNT